MNLNKHNHLLHLQSIAQQILIDGNFRIHESIKESAMIKPTGADFRAIRLLLGLSINDSVELLQVNHRTINRWERGDLKVRFGAYKEMLDLVDLVEDKAHDVITKINNMPDGHKIKILVYDNQADFVRYCLKQDSRLKLYSVHMAMYARVLFEIPNKVSLIRFNRENYENWLDDKKLTDSKGSLSVWTASI